MDLKKRVYLAYRLLLNQSGQGLVEYSMLLMLLAMVVISTLIGLGETVDTDLYKEACSAIINASDKP